MSKKFDFDELLSSYKSDPYELVDIFAVHTGDVSLKVAKGEEVFAPSGEWQQVPGTALYEINRERNPKIIASKTNGTVDSVWTDLNGQFVEAGERLLTIKHPLTQSEIIDKILKEVLSLFIAPETAKYFFSLEFQSRMGRKGETSVAIESGEEILFMSLMKRDTSVAYSGDAGVIYSIYFKSGDSVIKGEPLLSVCPADKLPLVEQIVARVKAEWKSQE